jgi:hypothetical protein
MKVGFVKILIGSLFTSMAVVRAFGQPEQPVRPKWEYKKVTPCSEADRKLDWNKLGDEGWEFFLYEPEIATPHASKCAVYHFKRIKPELSPATTSSSAQCNLPMAKAPMIRGFRLGMKLDEVMAIFPGRESEFQTAAKSPSQYGLVSVGIYQNNGSVNDKVFEGIGSYSFTFLDNEAIGIAFGLNSNYSPGIPWPLDELTIHVIEKFNLPGLSYWQSSANNMAPLNTSRKLNCDGFEIEVHSSALNSFTGGFMQPQYSASITYRIPKAAYERLTQVKRKSLQQTFKW